MDLKEKVAEIKYEYNLDQGELARILAVASTTLLFLSLHGVTKLNSSAERIDQLRSEYSGISGMIGTQEFNNTISALEDIRTGEIGQRMQYAAEVFRGLRDTSYRLRSVDKDIRSLLDTYRWLLLISILGEVAAVSLIYM